MMTSYMTSFSLSVCSFPLPGPPAHILISLYEIRSVRASAYIIIIYIYMASSGHVFPILHTKLMDKRVANRHGPCNYYKFKKCVL